MDIFGEARRYFAIMANEVLPRVWHGWRRKRNFVEIERSAKSKVVRNLLCDII